MQASPRKLGDVPEVPLVPSISCSAASLRSAISALTQRLASNPKLSGQVCVVKGRFLLPRCASVCVIFAALFAQHCNAAS